MRRSPSIVLESDDRDIYLVLNDYDRLCRAWCKTDEERTDRETIITYLMEGQYRDPVRVVALNTEQSWSRDVSAEIADEIAERCARDGFDMPPFLGSFVDRRDSGRCGCTCAFSRLARAAAAWHC